MPYYDVDINETIQHDFLEYTGHVMQERSLPDARDALKDGARKILYSQFLDKNTYKDKYMKGQAVVGQVLKTAFTHGDASAYSTLVRMGKPFAMPYPLEELQGNMGNQVDPENHAAGRYLECKLSELGTMLFDGIKKDAIEEWYWNYSDTVELPRVLPCYGFYPIVNGALGISVGLSTSIPSTNLQEVNEAIIKLIRNPEVDFDEIYCAPDFPMGGTIINGEEVKESMKNGCGKSVKIRSKIEYNVDDNTLIATEIPFSVYTHTIDAELEEIINNDEKSGIKKFIDATNDDGAKIIIYLEKGSNYRKIIKRLYKETSLESYYGINLIMLDNGRFPRVFPWRDALNAYITHIRTCKRREIQFDLNKALARENVVEGLILAAANIDEVVSIIRASSNPAEASQKLIDRFSFNEEQTKAILAMKLSSLTKIDSIKLNNEQEELLKKIEELRYLLDTPSAIDEILISILKEVADKFGDERRTKVINLVEKDNDEEEKEQIKEEDVAVMLFDNNTIRLVKTEDLNGSKRGKKGTNLKPPKGANLIKTIYSTNLGTLSAFTNLGRMYSFSLGEFEYGIDYSIYQVIDLKDNEKVLILIDTNSFSNYKNILFITKQGLIKKSATSEYGIRSKKGQSALKLKENDEIINVFLSSNENDRIMIASNRGYNVFFNHKDIAAIGRLSQGVKAIKLKENEYVAGATIVKENIEYIGILSITSSGNGKITSINDYNETSRAIKGNIVQKLGDEEELSTIYAVAAEQEKIFISANNKAVALNVKEIPVQGRVTSGVRLIDIRGTNAKVEVM